MVKRALTLIIIFQILSLSALGVLLYYLYKVRTVEKIITTDVQTNITDNSITKVKAESLTLDSLIQKKENPNFKESFLISTDEKAQTDSTNIQPIYKINSDGVVKSTNYDEKAIPMFFTDLNSTNFGNDNIVKLITTAIKQDSLNEIDIDVSIVNKVENIETVVKNIISTLSPNEIKINLWLPSKWSDNIDYSYLNSVSRFYNSNASISVLNNLCNKIRIAAYGYTTINSASAGPITKPEIATDTIKYYIYKGISSTKIDLVINKTAYMWANRSYTDNYLYNYILDQQQVIIVNANDLNNYISQSNFKIIKNFDNGENLGVLENNGNINYFVYPTLTQLSNLVDTAKSYGLNGFIFKNF